MTFRSENRRMQLGHEIPLALRSIRGQIGHMSKLMNSSVRFRSLVILSGVLLSTSSTGCIVLMDLLDDDVNGSVPMILNSEPLGDQVLLNGGSSILFYAQGEDNDTADLSMDWFVGGNSWQANDATDFMFEDSFELLWDDAIQVGTAQVEVRFSVIDADGNEAERIWLVDVEQP